MRDKTTIIRDKTTIIRDNLQTQIRKFFVISNAFRLDEDQATKRNSSKILQEFGGGEVHPDYYEFEAHIMFDDAMTQSKRKQWTLNSFVISFVKTVNAAARFVNLFRLTFVSIQVVHLLTNI